MPLKYTRDCLTCGTVFATRRPKQIYCSRGCVDTTGPRVLQPIADRFWSKVDKSGNCWIWTAAIRTGYGTFSVRRKTYRANRFVWELVNGPIPDGLLVLHNCPDGDNPLCVNPAHLWLGTNDENMADMVRKQRSARGALHHSVTHPERRPRGEAHAMSKLTEDAVREIRRDYDRVARNGPALAARFGVDRTTINHVVSRKIWRHI